MRRHTVLTVLALTLSCIFGMQLVFANMDANVIDAKVKIWPRWLFLSDYRCDNYDYDDSCHCERAYEWNCGDHYDDDCSHGWRFAGKWHCRRGKWHCRRGKWIIAFIILPKGYDVKDIDVSSVTLSTEELGGYVSVSKHRTFWRRVLIAKFDRDSVIDLLCPLIQHMSPWARQRVTLVVTGNLYDGKIFRGQDTITVFYTDH